MAFLLLSWFSSCVVASEDILRAKLKILVELFMITGNEFFFVEFLCGSGVGGIYNFYQGFFSGAPQIFLWSTWIHSWGS